jgi:hypothetical protein
MQNSICFIDGSPRNFLTFANPPYGAGSDALQLARFEAPQGGMDEPD